MSAGAAATRGFRRVHGNSLTGAAYDVEAQFEAAGPLMTRIYRDVFGSDPRRQRALSPVAHGRAPNAPAFLLLHVQRDDAIRQTHALGAALRGAGTRVEMHALPGSGMSAHLAINRQLGNPNYPGAAVVARWLVGILAGIR